MMGFSLGHLVVVLIIVLLFGGRRLPELGGALGKGLRSFKRGIEGKLDDEDEPKQRVTGPESSGSSAQQSAQSSTENSSAGDSSSKS